MKHPLFTKLAALLAVAVLLWIGLGLIGDVVRDRQHYRFEAVRSVAQSLAGPQTVMGPLLHSACVETWDMVVGSGNDRSVTEQRREFRLTAVPEQLNIEMDAVPEARARGLHEVNAYLLKAHVTAEWSALESLRPQATMKQSRLQCGPPVLMLAVADARGIRTARLTVEEQPLPLKPGTFHPVYTRGLHATLPDNLRAQDAPLRVSLDLELVGIERLGIVPLGSQTEVRMSSAWPHPSFGGRYLPSEREVRADGFSARWRLSSLASSAQQDVAEDRKLCEVSLAPEAGEYAVARAASPCVESLDVAFIDPVNPYSLSDRAIKYGLLFIALTFMAVGLFELMKAVKVHPVQYLLVGGALCSFFLLLVSLSEHLAFGFSYALAAASCVLLLTYYASHVLGGWRRGLPLGLGIAVLYGLLYLLLQLEQTALVVGALALFALLAMVMVLTRRVDWYGQSAGWAPPQAETPAAAEKPEAV